MARVELSFPDSVFTFSTEMTVRISDVNGAAHLSNEGMVAMLSEARAAFLTGHAVDETGQSGLGIIVTDLATIFQGESFYGERLRFDVGLTEFNRYGGDFAFRVTRVSDEAPIATAKYGFVFFDYEQRRVTPMPETFREAFEPAGHSGG